MPSKITTAIVKYTILNALINTSSLSEQGLVNLNETKIEQEYFVPELQRQSMVNGKIFKLYSIRVAFQLYQVLLFLQIAQNCF
jgi:hypothetical protein